MNRGASQHPSEKLKIGSAKPVHPHAWLWETVEHEPSFVIRAMFGAKALYLHGFMKLCFTASEEPWRGVLVCTAHEHHQSLLADFPSLSPHSILPKWLYLPESSPDFETTAAKLVRLAQAKDARIGIVPNVRKRRKAKFKRPSRSEPGKDPFGGSAVSGS
ncbi:MAG: hypothetical protein QM790_17980 [Nibricoccus sp.]